MSLTDLELKILAEGEKLYAVAKAEALKLRKSKLFAEIEAIEKELATLLGASPSADPAPEPASQPEASPEGAVVASLSSEAAPEASEDEEADEEEPEA